MTAIAHQAHRQKPLLHRACLPYASLVEAHEIGAFPGKVAKQHFSRAQLACETPGEIEAAILHASPPNTSTPAKRHAGEAWPQDTAWLGSPLPQYRVPCTSNVS